jgi:ferredoxin-type protein NapG
MMTSNGHSTIPGRRKFLLDSAGAVCGFGLLATGLGIYSGKASSLPAGAIRPPGAIDEHEFGGACIRCGLCVRDCPYDTLRLAGFLEDVTTGTPYFIARDVPCEMCEDIPCVKACPTGALDPDLQDIDDARMGLAALIDQETCLNFQGLRCDVCYRVCPLIDEAITLEMLHNPRSGKHALFLPTVHSDACTGCGKCEYACVLPEAAVKVFPRKLAKGEAAGHYRMGWEEKRKAGRSLVTPDTEHQYNLPQGIQYEHGGAGLKQDTGETPFAGDPLKTLNRHSGEVQ